jgi:hypothetical protein
MYILVEFLKRRGWILLILIVLAVIGAVVFIQKQKPKGVDYDFTLSGIPLGNNIGIIDDALYSYNGVVFSKTNLADNSTTKLTTLMNLPDITDITWGKSGALLKIEDAGQNSLIQGLITKNNLQGESLPGIVWYMDFKTSTLRPIVNYATQWNKALYVESSNQFVIYQGSLPAAKTDFFVFEENEQVIKKLSVNADIDIVEDIFNCTEGVCVSGKSAKRQTVLYLVNPKTKTTKLVTQVDSGTILPTSNPDYALISVNTEKVVQPSEKAEVSELDEESGISGTFKATQHLYQISSGKKLGIGDNSSLNSVAFVAQDSKDVVTTGEIGDSETQYYSGIMKDKSAPLEHKILKSTALISSPLYFKNGLGIAESNQNYILLAALGSEAGQTSLKKVPSISSLERCVGSSNNFTGSLDLKLTVESTQEIQRIRTCLYNSSVEPYLYRVSFEVLSVQRPIRP